MAVGAARRGLRRRLDPDQAIDGPEVLIEGHQVGPRFQGMSSDPDVIGRNGTALAAQPRGDARVPVGCDASDWQEVHPSVAEEFFQLVEIALQAGPIVEAKQQLT